MDDSIAQAKILRVFEFIAIVAEGKHNISRLADRLNTTTRTVYRYIKLIKALDFKVEVDYRGNYTIEEYPKWLERINISPKKAGETADFITVRKPISA